MLLLQIIRGVHISKLDNAFAVCATLQKLRDCYLLADAGVALLLFTSLINATLLRNLQKLDNSTLFPAADISVNTHLMKSDSSVTLELQRATTDRCRCG